MKEKGEDDILGAHGITISQDITQERVDGTLAFWGWRHRSSVRRSKRMTEELKGRETRRADKQSQEHQEGSYYNHSGSSATHTKYKGRAVAYVRGRVRPSSGGGSTTEPSMQL